MNDPPEFTLAGNPPVSTEDSGPQTVANFATNIAPGPATATDEQGQTLTFETTVLGTTGNLAFAAAPFIDPSGTLTYSTTPDSSGTATISVILSDEEGAESTTHTFTITVLTVNDPPEFTLAGNPPASSEDAGPQTVANFATNIAPGPATATDEQGQALTFETTVLGTTGNLAFAAEPFIDPASGTLTYEIAADTSGTATVQVILVDEGGAASSAKTFTLTVLSAEQQVGVLVADVNLLAAQGGFTNGDAVSLKSVLGAVMTSIIGGRENAADKQTNAFIHRVEVLVKTGQISTDDASLLIESAGKLKKSIRSLNETPAKLSTKASQKETEQLDVVFSRLPEVGLEPLLTGRALRRR